MKISFYRLFITKHPVVHAKLAAFNILTIIISLQRFIQDLVKHLWWSFFAKINKGFFIFVFFFRQCLFYREVLQQLPSFFQLNYFLSITAWKVPVFGVFLVRISPHSDWIRIDTEYLSVFSPYKGKYGPEKLRIRTLFTLWMFWSISILSNILQHSGTLSKRESYPNVSLWILGKIFRIDYL